MCNFMMHPIKATMHYRACAVFVIPVGARALAGDDIYRFAKTPMISAIPAPNAAPISPPIR
jgi:hypothetical protein